MMAQGEQNHVTRNGLSKTEKRLDVLLVGTRNGNANDKKNGNEKNTTEIYVPALRLAQPAILHRFLSDRFPSDDFLSDRAYLLPRRKVSIL